MAIRGYNLVHRRWRTRKPIWWMMLMELPLVVATLVFFGLAQPDVFRTHMWRIGYTEKWNSNPNEILYAYANHKPLPNIPFRWSQTLTDFNVAISVLSLFVLLSKLVAYIMKVYFPIVSVFVSLSMTALWATSVAGQAGPDYLDPRYPSPLPWYLTKDCSVAAKYNSQKTCMIFKGTFASTVLFLAIYSAHLLWAIWNMIPRKDDDQFEEDEENKDNNSRSSSPTTDDKGGMWEMQPQPQTPRGMPMPFTPRTQAFHTLDRKLPFRQYADRIHDRV